MATTVHRPVSNGVTARAPLTGVSGNRKGSRDASETGHLVPNRVGELGQKQTNISRSGSEADSLIDLYGHRTPNASNTNVNVDSDIPENMYTEDDPEGWVHRDKLAKIEAEELQAAGINLASARRPMSKRGARVRSSSSNEGQNSQERQKSQGREEKRQRIESPVEEEEGEHHNWDLRSPAEIAADGGADEAAALSPIYSNPLLRKSGSRIPVLTSSPLPIPQEHIERETPLPRSRTASVNQIDSPESIGSRLRPRGASVGSQVLLDEGEPVNATPTPGYVDGGGKASANCSPTKSKDGKNLAATPATAVNGTRKVTPAKSKIATPSKTPTPTTSPNARPVTRSGDPDRPKTAINRPEGDPPWLATMYKPDPRLPPDQQIIPTHAKRLQSAQWTEEGADARVYDTEFKPAGAIQAEFLPKEPQTPSPPVREKVEEEKMAWPLKPMASVRSNERPGTSGSAHGSYGIMPKVAQSPPAGVQMSSPRSSNFAPGSGLRQQLPPEEKEEKSGCGGCCVVM